MAEKAPKLPMSLRIHNVICLSWLLNIRLLRKIEPGCRAAAKRLEAKGQ